MSQECSCCIQTGKQRSKTPFRFDVVGSYLRPKYLKKAREDYRKGLIGDDQLKEIEDKAILDLIARQQDVGLSVITDGEFRRSWWHLDFFWGLNGVEKKEIAQGYRFNDQETRAETAAVTGKISGNDHPFINHYRFVKHCEDEHTIARQTIPAPAQFFAELQRPENYESTAKHYPDSSVLLDDISAAYRQVITDLYEAGCRSLQLDDCTWGMLVDTKYWEAHPQGRAALPQTAELFVALNNRILANQPDDLIITTHVCRGNYHSTWASSGGYDSIAPYLFAKENVDGFYLEYDTDRSGDFKPLEHVDSSKQVVLGLFSSKTGSLEDEKAIIDRIKEATQYIDLDQICLSPQCGFASTEEGNILSEEQQWEKLKLIKRISDQIWQ